MRGGLSLGLLDNDTGSDLTARNTCKSLSSFLKLDHSFAKIFANEKKILKMKICGEEKKTSHFIIIVSTFIDLRQKSSGCDEQHFCRTCN